MCMFMFMFWFFWFLLSVVCWVMLRCRRDAGCCIWREGGLCLGVDMDMDIAQSVRYSLTLNPPG